MKAFWLATAGVILLVVAIWSGSAAATENGALVLSVAGFCAALSILRVLPGVGRKTVSRPAGLGLLASLVVAGVALLAGTAQRSARLVELAALEVAEAQTQRLESLAAEMGALVAGVDQVLESLDGGHVVEANAKLVGLEGRFAPLRSSSLASRPAVSEALERLDGSRRTLGDAVEQQAVEEAARTLAARKSGVPAVVELLEVRTRLRTLGHPSTSVLESLAALDLRLLEVSRRLPALNQPLSLLDAKLGPRLGGERADGSRVLAGFAGAQAFSLGTAEKSTALYLVADPRSGALSPASANSFLEVAVGATVPVAFERPAGKGSRTTTVASGATSVHVGWTDGRLIELWVGDFSP